MATRELENGCELTAMLRSHLGIELKDDTSQQFGYLVDKISNSLASAREMLIMSDQNLLESKAMTSEGAQTNKRKRDNKFKNCQRRKCNNIRTELTPTPYNDGYQWRKYGQKNINDKKYPRCYYRCTYHSDQKCKASKQVQQYNDEYSPFFEVAYFDEHTCNTNIPNSKTTTKQNILDFSGKSTPESYLSMDTMFSKRQDEEAAVVSCLTLVVSGYNSDISENSKNGGHIQLYNTKESSLSTIDGDMSSTGSSLFRQDEFPVVNGINMDLEYWLEKDPLQFLLSLPPI